MMGNNHISMKIKPSPLFVACGVSLLAHALLLQWNPYWLAGNSIPAKARAPASNLKVSLPGTSRLLDISEVAPGAVYEKTEAQIGAGTAPSVSSDVSESTTATSSEIPLKDSSLLPGMSLDSYLPVSMLSVPPSPLDSIEVMPPGFRSQGLVGSIELLLLISSDGAVDDVLVVNSSLPEPLVHYAKQAFSKTQFSPGIINKTSVRSRVRFLLSPVSASFGVNSESNSSAKNRTR